MGVTNSTLAGNSVTAGSGATFGRAEGSDIYNLAYGAGAPSANLTLQNSILASQLGGIYNLSNNQQAGSATAKIASENLLLALANVNGGTVTGLPMFDDPRLDSLADNGGPTPTLALLPGSPAVGRGDVLVCNLPEVGGLDQRGHSRTCACDLGAFQFTEAGSACMNGGTRDGGTGTDPDHKIGFSGGGYGCSATGTSGSGGRFGLGMLLFAALMLRRPRRAERKMLAPFLVTLGLLLGIPSGAQAQSPPATGFAVSRHEPTPVGETSFAVDHPFYSAVRTLAAGVTLDYGHNPLLFGSRPLDNSSFASQGVLIGHQLLVHLGFAAALANRVLLSVSLPITVLERGDDASAARFGLTLVSTAAVGDPRLGAMFRIFGEPYASAFSLSLGGYLWIPINTNTFPAQVGESGFRFLPKLVLSGLSHRVLWSFTGGIYYRPEASLGNLAPDAGNSVGTELQLGAAIAYADSERRFSVGPEAIAQTTITGGRAFQPDFTSLELLLGVHYNIARLIQIGAAGGVGLLREPGTPDHRALLRVAYAPLRSTAPPDRDRDGIADGEDACPDEAGVRTGNPATQGCPPPPPPPADRDHDGVLDSEDRCVDEPAGPSPDPGQPGCPLRDRDGDGVFDSQDQCADEPAGSSPDPQKPGCPLHDRDGDGVLDPEDQCPDAAQGPHPDASRAGCPDRDSDGDGIYDSADQCKSVPAGMYPDAARPGCPLADRDQDGVPDAVDACPDKPGAPSSDPKKNGCPGLVALKGGKIVVLQQIFFVINKDVILKTSFPVLLAVADVLKIQPQIKRIDIEGHTDNQGKPQVNQELSERRSQSVRRFLIAHGIAESRLTAHGYGDTRPIASNKLPAGRALNRRVDFHIVDPPQAETAASPPSSVVATPAALPNSGAKTPAKPPAKAPAKPPVGVKKPVPAKAKAPGARPKWGGKRPLAKTSPKSPAP